MPSTQATSAASCEAVMSSAPLTKGRDTEYASFQQAGKRGLFLVRFPSPVTGTSTRARNTQEEKHAQKEEIMCLFSPWKVSGVSDASLSYRPQP